MFPPSLTASRGSPYDRNHEARKVQAMQRLTAFLCLIVLLLSPALCQAKAADGLERSLGEMVERGVIEPVNADEGDDLSSPLVKAETGQSLSLDRLAVPSLDTFIPALVPSTPLPFDALTRTPGAASWPLAPAPQRHAWLQVFRF